MPHESGSDDEFFAEVLPEGRKPLQKVVEELEEQLEAERDGRKEDRFIGLVGLILLLNVVFFSVMPSFGGPLALLVVELLVLIPIARRMGMQEIAQIMNGFISRIAGKASDHTE